MNRSPEFNPKSSLAALFHGAGRPLELQTLPLPRLAAGEALVRIDCSTICGSDLHSVTGARSEPVPSILGHEALGTVCDLGAPPPSDILGNPLAPGDRVTWSVAVSCGACDRCRGGLPQKCRNLAKYGHEVAQGRYALSGGLAEYIVLRPGSTVVKLPADIPDEVFCPVNCATATVAAAYRTAGNGSGKRVLIFGAGLLGLTAAAFGISRGASELAVCDVNPQRVLRAKQFGATHVVEWTADVTELRRRLSASSGTAAFDVIFEFSGSPDAVEAAFALADLGATIVLVGTVMNSRDVRLDPQRVVRQWLSIRGVHNYAPEDLRTAVEFLTRAHTLYPFAAQVEATFALSQANEAFENAIRNRPVRVAVRP